MTYTITVLMLYAMILAPLWMNPERKPRRKR